MQASIRNALIFCALALPLCAQSTTRASIGSGGVHSQGYSTEAWIRQDGRLVFFSSWDGLVPGDVDGTEDAHVHDRQTGETRLLVVGQGGLQPNDGNYLSSVSPDGRFAAFSTYAWNLDPNDNNASSDVFLFDRQTLAIQRVSVGSGNLEANGDSVKGLVSDDGRFVAFFSWATNLTPGDTNGLPDVFLHDVGLNATFCLTLNPQGVPTSTGQSELTSISGDGNWVSFYSDASDLVANDANGSIRDVFLYERASAALSIVSRSSSGAQGNDDSAEGHLTPDGRMVVFDSWATNLATGDNNGSLDVYLRDRLAGTTELVSRNNASAIGNSDSYRAKVNADGSKVSFVAWSSNLVPGDTNGCNDLFLRDRAAGTTERLSVTTSGGQMLNHQTLYPEIYDHNLSRDGRFSVFSTVFEKMVPGDNNDFFDVIVRDRASTCAPVTDYCVPKVNSQGCTPTIGASGEPRLSGYDAFFLTATDVLNKKTGLLLWSPNAASTPFGGGTLCLAAPIVRTPAQTSGGTPFGSDCTGVYSFHFSQTYMASQGLASGTTLRTQYWSRDNGFASPNNLGLTAGIVFTLHP